MRMKGGKGVKGDKLGTSGVWAAQTLSGSGGGGQCTKEMMSQKGIGRCEWLIALSKIQNGSDEWTARSKLRNF